MATVHASSSWSIAASTQYLPLADNPGAFRMFKSGANPPPEVVSATADEWVVRQGRIDPGEGFIGNTITLQPTDGTSFSFLPGEFFPVGVIDSIEVAVRPDMDQGEQLGLVVTGLAALSLAPSDLADDPFRIFSADDTFTGVVNVSYGSPIAIDGGGGSDTMDIGGAGVLVYGGAGDDDITVRGESVGYGGDGNDRLVAAGYDADLFGGDGHDLLYALHGDSSLFGGAGDDNYFLLSDNASTAVVESVGGGYDRVFSSADYTLPSNTERLYLTGSAARGQGNELDNVIYGNDLANDLTGGGGADYIIGGDGNDVIRGNAGGDILYGQSGNDQMNGGAMNDTLVGGDGDDGLAGGPGKDILFGGDGRDVFAFYAPEDTGPGVDSRDVIRDFSSEDDWIWLLGMDADSTQAGDQAFTWVGGTAVFSGSPGELHYFHKGQTTYVEGDIDGDGNADFQIEMSARHRLDVDDFFL